MKRLHDIANLVRYYRKSANLTQKQLAYKVGVSHSLISKIEAGNYQPHENVMKKIQHFLQIKELEKHENHQLSAQLSSWHKSINQRNITTSEQFYQQLKKFPISYFLNETSLYRLHCFQHALLILDIEKAFLLLPEILKETKKLTERASYPFYKAIGYYYVLTDALKQAGYYLEKAVSAKVEAYEYDGELHLTYAILHHKLENIPHSMDYSYQAIHLFQQKMDHRNVMIAQSVRALNDLQTKRYERGLKNLQNILLQLGNNLFINLQAFHCLLGLAYMHQQNYNKALYYAREAMLNEKNTYMKQSYIYLVAYIFALMQDKDQALDYIKAGMKLKSNKKYLYKLKTLYYIITGQINCSSCQKHLEDKAIPFLLEKGDMAELRNCYRLLGNSTFSLHHYKQAAQYYERASENHQIAELLAKYQ